MEEAGEVQAEIYKQILKPPYYGKLLILKIKNSIRLLVITNMLLF